MGKKDKDKQTKDQAGGKKQKLLASTGAVFQYQLKTPAIYDFYEGEAPLDWEVIKASHPLRVVFQATFGRHGRHNDDKPDNEVANFVAQAKANGIKYGLYHFLVPNSISEQADFYINTVRSLGGLGDMQPIVDVEFELTGKGKAKKNIKAISSAEWASQIKTWLDLVTLAFKMKPMIYTNANYWSFTHGPGNQPPAWSTDYPLWTAGYPDADFVDKNVTCPPVYIPAPWKEWAIWQYAEDGRTRKYGANDLNLVHESYTKILENPLAVMEELEKPTVDVPVSVISQPEGGIGSGLKHVTVTSPKLTYTVQAGEKSSSINLKFDVTIELEFANMPGQTIHFDQQMEVMDVTTQDPGVVPLVPKEKPPADNTVSTKRYAIVKHIPRDVLKGKFAPDTVTLGDAPKGGGKGKAIPIPISWWSHIGKINSANGLKYARSVGMMWINIKYEEGQTPKAERIMCGGNFVSILEESGQHYRIDSFNSDMSTSSLDPATDNWFHRPEVFFKAIAVNAKGDLINVAKNLDVYFPVLNRSGDNLWILKEKVELFAALPVDVTVTADAVDVRESPGMDGKSASQCHKGETVRVLEYRPLGASVWGRTMDGWIPLLLAETPGSRSFPTSWKLGTVGVIPPA